MVTGELKSKIDKVWEAFWTGGLSNPLTVIEQMTYLLFIRKLDEEQKTKEAEALELQQPIQNPIYLEQDYSLRWSRFKDLEATVLFNLFTQPNGVFDFIRNLGNQDSIFSQSMRGATFMIPTPRLLAQVVDMVDKIPMHARDTKGDIYEYLLSKIASAGHNGQFRTPRHIIKMMVELVQPTLQDVICDPSAGTCGFLVEAHEFIRLHFKQQLYAEAAQLHLNTQMFMGMEFDPTMIRIGAMNLMLHGIEQPKLKAVDALSEANHAFEQQASLILANPPFKGSLDREAVDAAILKRVDSKKTELLFIALILKGLTMGGRAAVIVPDGVLFGSSSAHLQLRQNLMDRQRLQAVISMPSGVFKPYAGVSTAVLLFTKTEGGGTTDSVWFYDMRADGLSLDDKRVPIAANDIPDIIARFKNGAAEARRLRTEQSFCVPVQEIRDNKYDLSINRYKQVVYEAKTYLKPHDIIQQIQRLDEERNELLEQLKLLLA